MNTANVALTSEENIHNLLQLLGIDSTRSEVEKITDGPYPRFHIPECIGSRLPDGVGIIVTCLDSTTGVQDAQGIPGGIEHAKKEVPLPVGELTDSLKGLNEFLKAKMPLYTIESGFATGDGLDRVHGKHYFVRYVFFTDGKTNILTVYEAVE